MLLTRLRLGLPRYARYTRENPTWAVMFVLGRLRVVRNLVRGKPRYASDVFEPVSVTGPSVDTVLSDLDRDGYSVGLRMQADALAEVRRFAERYRSGKAVSDHIGEKRTIVILDEFLDLEKECPILARLAADPFLRSVARRYLNCDPVHIGTKLWWSLAKESTLAERIKFAQELFHYDVHDFVSVKFSFYITDVHDSTGPHVYIAGSHNRKRVRDQITALIGRTDSYITGVYGADRQVRIVGQAGLGFAHDPYCYHKATRPTAGDRLMLQFEFARHRYQKKPFATAVPLRI
jgi:hypothetical protein